MSDFPVIFTPAAIAKIKLRFAREAKEGSFVRVGVKGGGCSGFEYVLLIDDKKRDNDFSLVLPEFEVRCDSKSATFLEGTQVDFSGNLIGGGLVFQNPNAVRSCGCGTSFTPKGF